MSIRKDTLTNLAGAIVPMIILLITVPLYLKVLGEVRYGVLALVWVVLGYFAFLDLGLGRAVSNHIARLHDGSDQERGQVFWSAVAVNGMFGVVASTIFWIVSSYLIRDFLKIPVELQREVYSTLPWMVLTLPLALVTSVLNGALEGRGRFLQVNILQVVGTIIFQGVPLIVAYIYSGSLSYVIPAAVLSRAFMNVPLFLVCVKYISLSSRPKVDVRTIKSLLSYGGWVAVSGILGPIIETVDRFFIGAMLGAHAVTYYTVPYQLVTKARVIPGSLSRALFTKFSSTATREADHLAYRSLLVVVGVMTPIVLCVLLLLKIFMIFWIGEDLALITAPVGIVLLLGVWINCIAQVPCFLLMGKGRPDVVAKLHSIEVIPFLLALFAMMHQWGILGAAWAWTLRSAVDSVLLIKISNMKSETFSALLLPAIMLMLVSGSILLHLNDMAWIIILVILCSIFIWRWIKLNRSKLWNKVVIAK